MEKLEQFLQEKLLPLSERISQNPFMSVLRDSVLVLIPLTIIGCIASFVTNFPNDAVATALAPVIPLFTAINTTTIGLCGLIVAICVGFNASKLYDINTIYGVVISVSAFLTSQLNEEIVIDPSNFGANGVFVAIVVGFFAIYVTHLFLSHNVTIKMPPGVPPMLSDSFGIIIPLTVVVAIIAIIKVVLGFDINQFIIACATPLTGGLSTLPGLMIYLFLTSLLWLFGINPAIIFSILVVVILQSTEANLAAVAAGAAPTAMCTWGLETIFNCGGTGTTLGLNFLMLKSKSKTYKALGRASIVPGICSINEPLVFGLPLVFNPVYAIPFFLAPQVALITTWFGITSGILGFPTYPILWNIPPILNGWLSSGGSITMAIWSGLVVVISAIIYYPFFKIGEKQELEREAAAEAEEAE